MANFVALPVELKDSIICQTTPADMYNLTKTCKALRDVARPALYRTISISPGASSSAAYRPSSTFIPLLRTVIESPSLAAHVRKVEFLEIDSPHAESEWPAIRLDLVPEHEQALFSEALDSAGIIEKNYPGSLITLFLMRCEKVEELVICNDVLSFIDLTHLSLTTRLATLRLRRCAEPPQTLERLLQHTPKLKLLEYDAFLASSTTPLDCTVLRNVLHHVRSSLTELVIQYDVFADQAEDPENLVRVCAGSLQPLRDLTSLESLHISLAVLFGQVREVDAPLLADILPASLQQLTICDDMWGYDAFTEWEGKQIMAVLKAFFVGEKRVDGEWNAREEDYDFEWERAGEPGWKSATPKLKEFVLDIRKRGHQLYYCWDVEQSDEVKRMCQSQGIKCEVLEIKY